jgi:hypothetical protein
MKIIYKAALGLSTLNPDGKVTRAEVISAAMLASGNFPAATMPISYVVLGNLKTNLHTAIVAAANGVPGSTSHMHEQERILISAFNMVRAFVEQAANNNADPKTIIESAGMTVISTSGNTPVTELTLTPKGNGVIQINVPRNSGEAAFVYQYSTDAVTWTEFAMSKLATVELQNQNPASILNIRFAAIGKTKGAFSQPKSVIVL